LYSSVCYGTWRNTHGTKAIANVVTDRLSTALSGGEVGREEKSEGVVGELHVCELLWTVKVVVVCLFVDLLWVAKS
jgi:hypothetical protein